MKSHINLHSICQPNSRANTKRLICPHLQKTLNIFKFYSSVIVTWSLIYAEEKTNVKIHRKLQGFFCFKHGLNNCSSFTEENLHSKGSKTWTARWSCNQALWKVSCSNNYAVQHKTPLLKIQHEKKPPGIISRKNVLSFAVHIVY